MKPMIRTLEKYSDHTGILGYDSSKTTEIYTHVSKANLAKIENPLDRLMKEEGK